MGREGESKCCCVMLVEVMLGDHDDRMLLVCYEMYHGNVLSLSLSLAWKGWDLST